MLTIITSVLLSILIQCCDGVAENPSKQTVADQYDNDDAATASTTFLRRREQATATMTSIYIDCGNNRDYKDALGRVWKSDTWYEGGFAYDTKSKIANVKDEYLYQTERAAQNQFDYKIPLSAGPGKYSVSLHMAEIFHVLPKQRVFDIIIEKNKPIYDIDIIARTGKPNMSLTLTRTVYVKDPPLDIEFVVGEIGFPKVNAIEVHKLDDSATLTVFPPIRPKIVQKPAPQKPPVNKNPPQNNKVAQKPPPTQNQPQKPVTNTNNYYGGVIQKPLPTTITQATTPITSTKRSVTKNQKQNKHKD